jgi:hypothetical protein
MRLSRFIAVALCLLASTAVVPAAAQARKPAKPCPGGSAVERSVQARVYERGADDHVLVGCYLRSGRRTGLAGWFSCGCSIADDPEPQVWLAGRHVAVNQYSCSPIDPMSPCVGSLKVVDLRSGRVRYSAETGSMGGLVIKRNGSVAYVLGQRLIRIDSTGSTVLDEGPGIDGDSLAANPTRLYWMRDGVPKAASFR